METCLYLCIVDQFFIVMAPSFSMTYYHDRGVGMKRILLILPAIIVVFTLDIRADEGSSLNFLSAHGGYISHEETMLLTAPETQSAAHFYGRSYFLKAGGAYACYDEDFRDFLDYGGTISFGIEQQLKKKLSASIVVDLTMLKGKWGTSGDRESIEIAAEEWHPGFYEVPNVVITAEDLPAENLGTSSHGGIVLTIDSADSLKSIDVKTTLYLLPVTVNALYSIHDEARFRSYMGGGIGFCLASREVDLIALKEESAGGAINLIKENTHEMVTGIVLHLFAGIEIPLKDRLNFVVEAKTALYDLENYDPVLSVSYRDESIENPTVTSFSYQQPLEIGVFQEEFVSSLMIGIVVPF